jgi:hypothetical protein
MKYLHYYILVMLCGNIISCKSPTQPDQTPVNDPPVVTITGNYSTLSLGDTLRLTLHASDLTLTSGTVDFKDSTVVVLNKLKSVLDTTLIHIYKAIGSYDVTASLSDGDKVTTKDLDIVVSNYAPVVTLVVNKTSLNIGDTLKVTLHASDATLSNGTLDFKDGSIIPFSKLNRTFDTTIAHVYSQLGTYSVAASFSDGYSATNAFASVTIQHYYILSFSVGMVWRYSYSYWNGNKNGYSLNQNGIHEWKIISFTAANQDTTFTVRQTRSDSVYIAFDTSYVIKDTSQFTIVVSYSSIQFNTPLSAGSFSVPNHTYITSYPIILGYNFAGGNYGYMQFEDIVGLSKSYLDYSSQAFVTENFTLNDFIKL